MMDFLMVLGAALAYTVGGIFMKLSEGLMNPLPTFLVYACFMAGATLQTVVMRKGELGITYIIVLAVEAVLAFGFGIIFFREQQAFIKYVAVALIVGGIALLRGTT
jgi:small multidrug resistance pump